MMVPMKRRLGWRLSLGVGAVVLIVSLASACSPMYVIRAGIAEAKILRARRPIPEVILDPATPERTKTKLTFVVEARNYAIDVFELDVGRSYTSFSRLHYVSRSRTLHSLLSRSPYPTPSTVSRSGAASGPLRVRSDRRIRPHGPRTYSRDRVRSVDARLRAHCHGRVALL